MTGTPPPGGLTRDRMSGPREHPGVGVDDDAKTLAVFDVLVDLSHRRGTTQLAWV